MNNTVFKLSILLESGLLKSHYTSDILEGFGPAEWVPRLIEKDLVKHKDRNFYKALARLYGLEYVTQIQTPLNPKEAIAYRVPTQVLIESQLYPFEINGRLYIASSTPFIEKALLDNVLSFTGRAGYRIILTSQNQVRKALQTLYYIEFSVVAQNNLRYSKNELSASPPVIALSAKIVTLSGFAIIILAYIFPNSLLLVVFFIINLLYLYLNALRFATFIVAIVRPDKTSLIVTKREVRELSDSSLPRYTILVPLRFEAEIAGRLVKRLVALDYPKSKLEVLFLVGVDDEQTIATLQEYGVDRDDPTGRYNNLNHMTIVKVPKVQIDTKPLVCNYGLQYATGNFTVIYDAEDKPEVDQLKKAVVGFQASALNTICLQGKLNFYNIHWNVLTRLFSLEYGMWYGYFLPGLQALGSPIPLGGTSNHFVTNALRNAGEWDPYNVTEDADLGMRIYRSGHQTRILNTFTYEEATSTLGAWIKQRSRWEKGFLATLIVHVQHPIQLYHELGAKKFILGITIFFGNFYMPFINPLLWVLTILWLLHIFSFGTLPTYIWIPAVVNLVVGNSIHMIMHFMSAIRSKQYTLAPLVLIVPLYWILISIATYRSCWELLFRPYQWVKTAHGADR